MENNFLDISWKAILKVAFTAILCYLLFILHDIVIWFLFALVISILLKSSIDFFHHWRIPHWGAVLLTYAVIFGILGGITYLSVPVIFSEVRQIATTLPTYLAQFSELLQRVGLEMPFDSLKQLSLHLLQQTPENISQAINRFAGGAGALAFILTMAVFLSFERKGFGEVVAFLSARRYQKRILKAWQRARKEVSSWFGMRVIGALFITVSYFLTYKLLNVRAALVLALLAGILDFIPYFGPLAATLLGGLLTGIQFSWPIALGVIIILFALQIIESHVLTPLVGKKLIGLPPYLIFLAVTIGGQLFGIFGAFFAIPVAAIIYRFVIDFKTGEYQEERLEERRVEIN